MPAKLPTRTIVDERSARLARRLLKVCLGLFVLFCLNVILGKLRVAAGLDVGFVLPDVLEFLLLLSSALFFTLAALAREKAMGSRPENESG